MLQGPSSLPHWPPGRLSEKKLGASHTSHFALRPAPSPIEASRTPRQRTPQPDYLFLERLSVAPGRLRRLSFPVFIFLTSPSICPILGPFVVSFLPHLPLALSRHRDISLLRRLRPPSRLHLRIRVPSNRSIARKCATSRVFTCPRLPISALKRISIGIARRIPFILFASSSEPTGAAQHELWRLWRLRPVRQ